MASATPAPDPKMKSTNGERPLLSKSQKVEIEGEEFIIAGKSAEEWKEKAADRLVQGADWLAGATSRLSDRIATAAHNDKVRERAMQVVGVATSAGGLIASQASKIDVKAAYRKSADYAREHPKTAIVGGVAAAAAAYGLYRAVRKSKQNPSTDFREAPQNRPVGTKLDI